MAFDSTRIYRHILAHGVLNISKNSFLEKMLAIGPVLTYRHRARVLKAMGYSFAEHLLEQKKTALIVFLQPDKIQFLCLHTTQESPESGGQSNILDGT